MNMLNRAALIGFKVYKWNEKLPFNNVLAHQGPFVFRQAHGKLVQCVPLFILDDLVMCLSNIDEYFAPRPKVHAFLPLTNSLSFEHVVFELARETNLFLLSCIHFEEFTICCLPSPRLVFVADKPYTEAWRLGCVLLNLAPKLIQDGAEDVKEDKGGEWMFDGECNSGDWNAKNGVEDNDTGEMVEIVEELRMFCNAMIAFPLEPLSPDEPLKLMEEETNLDITKFKEPTKPNKCLICLDPLVADKVVLKTRCGHVYHSACSLPWFNSEFKCPMCRSSTTSIL